MDKKSSAKQRKVVLNALNSWPKTSDKEFSKRMFIIFMWAFFIHIVMTAVLEVFFGASGAALDILVTCIPVYSTIFAAVIVKGGVENVFKGMSLSTGSGRVKISSSDEDEIVIEEISEENNG